jgi:hypothetical protein
VDYLQVCGNKALALADWQGEGQDELIAAEVVNDHPSLPA